MSQTAVLKAMKSWLQTELGDAAGRVTVEPPPGYPPPASPDLCLVVMIGSTSNDSEDDTFINETYQPRVLIYRKTGQTPSDYRRLNYLDAAAGLERMARKVQRAFHGRGDFRIYASTLLTEGIEFSSNLAYKSMGEPYSWTHPLATNADLETFLVQSVEFMGLRRTQNIEVLP